MILLDCIVYGVPVPQGRPRAFKMPNGAVRVYDPENSRDWKRTVLAQVLVFKPERPSAAALALSCAFTFPRPKSLPKRIVNHVRRPDCSNLVKAIEDALNGVVYLDDSQIVKLEVTKTYGETPGVAILVVEL